MKALKKTHARQLMICLCLSIVQQVSAQGFDTPLTMQGLNRATMQSAASRAMGGVTLVSQNDVSLMFANPASLATIDGLQLSLGGMMRSVKENQDQRYGALQGYSAFNLLTESLTGQLSDPDTTGKTTKSWTYADSVQRPFDSILPDWNRAKSKSLPIQATIAAPVTIGGMKFVIGLGAVEYANLDWYYQNNNCFTPSVLSVLNGTIQTASLNANPYITQWYEIAQDRSGSIYGYGGMISAAVSSQISAGISGMVLKGSTDDAETRIGRGRMVFYTSGLRLDEAGKTSFTTATTSDYSGFEWTGSVKLTSKFIDLGVSLKPPTTITRSFTSATITDSVTAVHVYAKSDSLTMRTSTTASGQDKMKLPWRGSVGFALKIRENITIGMEYEIRAFESAAYTGADGTSSNPWLTNSIIHLGGEYRVNEWLTLRAGAGNYKEPFEPVSNPIRGDAVNYPVYSAGIGIAFNNAVLNMAYEYSDMKYVDMWSNAASINQQVTNSVSANVSYTLPWGR